MERADAHAIDRARACWTDAATARASSGSPALHLDDDAGVAMPRQHVVEPRDADALAAKRMRAVELEMEAGIDARELRGASAR